jgi:hypothetical protein
MPSRTGSVFLSLYPKTLFRGEQMSLEIAIQENTLAIRELIATITQSTAGTPRPVPLLGQDEPIAEIVQAQVAAAKTAAVQAQVAAAKTTAENIAAKPPARIAEPEPAPEAEPEAPRKPIAAIPDGERNKEFYDKHVLPEVVKLAKFEKKAGGQEGKKTLIGLLTTFGVGKASEVPGERWEELVIKLRSKLKELEG